MPLRFTHRILEHLAHTNYEPATVKAIARQLGTDPQDREVFREAIDQLREQGRVDITRDELVALPSYGEEVEGVFRLTSRGFGFVIPDHPCREGDLFVPPGGTRDAISGDRVRAKVIRQSGRSRGRPGRSPFTGRILEVLERGRDNFVGVLLERGGQWFVEPDGRVLYEPVLIRDPHAKSAGRARAGDKVVIELMHYPDDRYVPEGVITRVLGEAGKPDVETEAVIAAHGLRTEFPDAVVKRARKANRSFEAEARGPGPDRDDCETSSRSPSIRRTPRTSTTPSRSAMTRAPTSGPSACTLPTWLTSCGPARRSTTRPSNAATASTCRGG